MPRLDFDAEREYYEALVRQKHAPSVDRCLELVRLVGEAMDDRRGRAADLDSADTIVLAELARATKTCLAILHLVLGGFGQQASMLNRVLFEAIAAAVWATIEPDLAVDRSTNTGDTAR